MRSCGEQSPAGQQQPAQGPQDCRLPSPRLARCTHLLSQPAQGPQDCRLPSPTLASCTHLLSHPKHPQALAKPVWAPTAAVGRLRTTAIPDQGRNLPLSETICFHLKKKKKKNNKKMPTPKLTSTMRQTDITYLRTQSTEIKHPPVGILTENA